MPPVSGGCGICTRRRTPARCARGRTSRRYSSPDFFVAESVLTLRTIQPPASVVGTCRADLDQRIGRPQDSIRFRELLDLRCLHADGRGGVRSGGGDGGRRDRQPGDLRASEAHGADVGKFLFNAAAPPVAMWISRCLFFRASGIQPLYMQPLGLDVVGPWLLVFAGLYFFLNTFAIAVIVSLRERANVLSIWRKHFQGLWFTFIGGALGAAFVVFALQLGTYGMVILASRCCLPSSCTSPIGMPQDVSPTSSSSRRSESPPPVDNRSPGPSRRCQGRRDP